VCDPFGANLLVGGLPGVLWEHVLGSGCVYLFAVVSFECDEGRIDCQAPLFFQKSVTSTGFVAMRRNVRRVGPECGCTTNQTNSSHRWTLKIQREINILRDGRTFTYTNRTDQPISRASWTQFLSLQYNKKVQLRSAVPYPNASSTHSPTAWCSHLVFLSSVSWHSPRDPFSHLQQNLAHVINTRPSEGEYLWPCGQRTDVGWSCMKPVSNILYFDKGLIFDILQTWGG